MERRPLSIRVYALTRELKTETSVVFDLCRKAGVRRNERQRDKGSDSKSESGSELRLTVLSQLSDEEADRIRKLFEESRFER